MKEVRSPVVPRATPHQAVTTLLHHLLALALLTGHEFLSRWTAQPALPAEKAAALLVARVAGVAVSPQEAAVVLPLLTLKQPQLRQQSQ